MNPVLAQESTFRVHHVMDLPPGLIEERSLPCSLEFREDWVIDPAGASISKKVEDFEFPCEDSTVRVTLPDVEIRVRNVSYEFTFLDLPEQKAKEVQLALLALMNKRYSIPEAYDPPEQVLSVYFHEDWIIEAGHRVFHKKVRAITPVIWQRRQTADGEALPDAETGYPVFFKLALERVDLRQP